MERERQLTDLVGECAGHRQSLHKLNLVVHHVLIVLVLPAHNNYPLHTHTHPFNGIFSQTTRVSRYQTGETNLDFTEARDSEWQWHQLGHMQVCTSHQTDNHASIPPLRFLQAGCPSCCPTNSIKALKVRALKANYALHNDKKPFTPTPSFSSKYMFSSNTSRHCND